VLKLLTVAATLPQECNDSAIAMPASDAVSVLQDQAEETHVKNPAQPDTQQDEYMPDAPNSHQQRAGVPNADVEGINPRNTSSMPRGEDDERTRADSPELNDRTDVGDAGTATPPRAPR
jgi:hypothetical protein